MAVTLGPSGVTFPSGHTLYNWPGGAAGETWVNVLASRAKNVTYTNTTGKQLWVSIYATGTTTSHTITVEGYPIFYTNTGSYTQSFLFCVNKGSQYAWASTGGTLVGWKELRFY